MESIEAVFAFNVRHFRGTRTQAQVSEGADIPMRTYQSMEDGVIPKKLDNLLALARFHGVSVTRFFLDPDLAGSAASARDSLIAELVTAILGLNENQLESLLVVATGMLDSTFGKSPSDLLKISKKGGRSR